MLLLAATQAAMLAVPALPRLQAGAAATWTTKFRSREAPSGQADHILAANFNP
jgi:hypothetical protein